MNVQSKKHFFSADVGPMVDRLGQLLSPASFWLPLRSGEFSGWTEHAPFAFWLTAALRPRCFVELGTHTGYSYSAVCQAVQASGLATQCYAVDTWQGDEHAGFYGEEVFEDLFSFNNFHFSHFSRLVRSTFRQALDHFEDGSIDLLHIDGCHDYNDVRRDFRDWECKLSRDAVVLFHDINVRERGFGVARFWNELRHDRPHFSFLHGNGLGVLGYGDILALPVRHLFDCSDDPDLEGQVRAAYSRLGSALTKVYSGSKFPKAKLAQTRSDADAVTTELEALEADLNSAQLSGDELVRRLAEATKDRQRAESTAAELTEVRREQAALQASHDRLTWELEQASDRLRQADLMAAELGDLRVAHSVLQTTNEGVVKARDEAEGALRSAQMQAHEFQQELWRRSARINDLQGQLASQIQRADELQRAKLSVEEQLVAAVAECEVAAERLRSAQTQAHDFQQEIWRRSSFVNYLHALLGAERRRADEVGGRLAEREAEWAYEKAVLEEQRLTIEHFLLESGIIAKDALIERLARRTREQDICLMQQSERIAELSERMAVHGVGSQRPVSEPRNGLIIDNPRDLPQGARTSASWYKRAARRLLRTLR